ncbi:hypothetical protein N7478_007873 [Penicillium angulare]|uniref:uncharacterized protein n=1 Tax=Penicillium angulare TaxID=116970 RepID=UPI002542632D|nr:uncharacterized protein N7478_007873 [Penicillium angulare]KAJ5272748.1 hypothetical protein N7478_007873 [Penicillium angulare]
MGPYVPPGQSPPFEVVDDFHHGAWIIITAALGLVISLVCFLIRLYVRLMLIPPFARDDFVLLAATLIATSDAFALVVIYLSKCCVVAIYFRLTPQKPHNRASWATFALCTVWLISAVFILLVNCELKRPWRVQGGQCHNLFRRWKFIAAVDIITELILFSLAVALLKGLFMSIKRKLGIGFAFIFRFPLIIFTLLHMSSLNSALADNDVTIAAIEPTLWLQVELHYALVACSVFCLRPFMAAVSTNYGTAGDSNLESSASRSRETKSSSKSGSGSGSGSNSASRSRSLSRVRRKRAGTGSKLPRSGSKEQLCRDKFAHGGLGADAALPDKKEKKKKAVGMKQRGCEKDAGPRAPMRRSMFPLGQPISSKPNKPVKANQGKSGERILEEEPALLEFDSDAIELMPQLQRQHARTDEAGPASSEDPDRMVIRKEVEYSVQYEYEGRRRERIQGEAEGVSKKSSTDAMAYV